MKPLTKDEISRLQNTKSEEEWNTILEEVKASRDGKYPEDWFIRILLGGMMVIAKRNWRK